jgi:hypothetical protein
MFRALNQSILAMAQHDLKNSEAAERALAEVSRIFKRLSKAPGMQHQPDFQIAEILYREAQTKFNGKKKTQPAPEADASLKHEDEEDR